MEINFDSLIYGVMFFMVVSLIIKIFKHGFKGSMFGSNIKNKLGVVNGCKERKLIASSLVVHELDSSPEKAIGIELVVKSPTSYRMTPITLSNSEAEKLIEIIGSVTRKK